RTRPSSPLFPYTTLFRSEGGVKALLLGSEFQHVAEHGDPPASRNPARIVRYRARCQHGERRAHRGGVRVVAFVEQRDRAVEPGRDRKSTRLNSSHVKKSY